MADNGGSSSKAKYQYSPIVNKYREGKVKSTPERGVKQYLKPCAYKELEPARVITCLLENDPTS